MFSLKWIKSYGSKNGIASAFIFMVTTWNNFSSGSVSVLVSDNPEFALKHWLNQDESSPTRFPTARVRSSDGAAATRPAVWPPTSRMAVLIRRRNRTTRSSRYLCYWNRWPRRCEEELLKTLCREVKRRSSQRWDGQDVNCPSFKADSAQSGRLLTDKHRMTVLKRRKLEIWYLKDTSM